MLVIPRYSFILIKINPIRLNRKTLHRTSMASNRSPQRRRSELLSLRWLGWPGAEEPGPGRSSSGCWSLDAGDLDEKGTGRGFPPAVHGADRDEVQVSGTGRSGPGGPRRFDRKVA